MRTTLDIDPRALAAARAKAAAEHLSLGRAVSQLILDNLADSGQAAAGFPCFETVPGHTITNQLVTEHQEQISA